MIIQAGGMHDGVRTKHCKNDHMRECLAMQHAFRANGWEADVWGIRLPNFETPPDFDSYDYLMTLENYELEWLPDFSKITKPVKMQWIIDLHCIPPGTFRHVTSQMDIVLHSTKSLLDGYKQMHPDKEHVWFPNSLDDRYFTNRHLKRSKDCIFVGNWVNREPLLRALEAPCSNILYLLSHKTLTDFEIPILRHSGHHCYIPKTFNSLSAVNSINYATPFECDKQLNISQEDLALLNDTDFFNENTVFSAQHLRIINENFVCIFLTPLTPNRILAQLVEHFSGNIYFRFFGLDGTKTYQAIMKTRYAPTVYKSPKIKYIFSYKEIMDFEFGRRDNDMFDVSNSCYIPLGLPDVVVDRIRQTYNPVHNNIAFVCSRTDEGMGSYYGRVYTTFMREFQGFPYTIFGKNNNNISHLPHIQNNLSDKEYYSQISNCKCLFYHGVEERHLHYHPLEAMVIGMPVVFFEQSLLSSYLHNSEGMCKTYKEARGIIHNILNNDERLIHSILTSQHQVVDQLLVSQNLGIFDHLLTHPEHCGVELHISKFGEEMLNLINATKVHFNRSMSKDVNYRCFETLGCGACLLTNHLEELEELGFEDGVNCFMYKGEDEIKEKLRLALDNWERVGKAGEEFVKEHTYTKRVESLISTLMKHKTAKIHS